MQRRVIEDLLTKHKKHFRRIGSECACEFIVSTVDGFQGRETDGVVFSAVRSNKRGLVGFLHDQRRMNVAFTRARSTLVVIGSRQTLRTDHNWSRCCLPALPCCISITCVASASPFGPCVQLTFRIVAVAVKHEHIYGS